MTDEHKWIRDLVSRWIDEVDDVVSLREWEKRCLLKQLSVSVARTPLHPHMTGSEVKAGDTTFRVDSAEFLSDGSVRKLVLVHEDDWVPF